MVSIIKRNIRGKEYYSLQYSYRDKGKVKTLYKEIGKEIPENLGQIKLDFIKDIFQKRWFDFIEDFTKKFRKRFESLPTPIQAKDLMVFGIRFTYHSNKIEGSTLTFREVASIIQEPNIPINKSPHDIMEAKLHMEIYNKITNSNFNKDLTREMVQEWHKELFSLHPQKDLFAGLIREEQNYIGGSDFVPPKPELVKLLLKELFEWYDDNKDSMHPVLLACLMHFRFVSIHPFLDGNGRMCRLIMNFILYKFNYPMCVISYGIRISYYKALEDGNLKQDEMAFVGWYFRNYFKYLNSLQL